MMQKSYNNCIEYPWHIILMHVEMRDNYIIYNTSKLKYNRNEERMKFRTSPFLLFKYKFICYNNGRMSETVSSYLGNI